MPLAVCGRHFYLSEISKKARKLSNRVYCCWSDTRSQRAHSNAEWTSKRFPRYSGTKIQLLHSTVMRTVWWSTKSRWWTASASFCNKKSRLPPALVHTIHYCMIIFALFLNFYWFFGSFSSAKSTKSNLNIDKLHIKCYNERTYDLTLVYCMSLGHHKVLLTQLSEWSSANSESENRCNMNERFIRAVWRMVLRRMMQ